MERCTFKDRQRRRHKWWERDTLTFVHSCGHSHETDKSEKPKGSNFSSPCLHLQEAIESVFCFTKMSGCCVKLWTSKTQPRSDQRHAPCTGAWRPLSKTNIGDFIWLGMLHLNIIHRHWCRIWHPQTSFEPQAAQRTVCNYWRRLCEEVIRLPFGLRFLRAVHIKMSPRPLWPADDLPHTL